MTTKPDWCPQEVWMEALVRVGTSDNVEMHATWISRAILKAKNDAYEEASRVALSYGESGDPFVQFDSEEIAQAIRNLKHKAEV